MSHAIWRHGLVQELVRVNNQENIKDKHQWPFVRTIHRWSVDSPHYKGPVMRKAFYHDDVIKWKHFPRYWPFLRGIHRSPVNSPHKGQWRGASMFSFICAWTNGWANNLGAGDLSRYRAHYGVTVMILCPASIFEILFCAEEVWEPVSVHWRQGKCQLLANCLML